MLSATSLFESMSRPERDVWIGEEICEYAIIDIPPTLLRRWIMVRGEGLQGGGAARTGGGGAGGAAVGCSRLSQDHSSLILLPLLLCAH